MVYNAQLGLLLADTCLLAVYSLLFGFEIFVMVRYLYPLRIKSPYIISFYIFLTVLMLSSIIELFLRLILAQTGYYIAKTDHVTASEVCQHLQALSYILLGFVISATMFQLSCSLALVLNIIDIKEANGRKVSFNLCVGVIGIVCSVGGYYETAYDRYAQKQHLIYETLGLLVLCLIYFSTCVDLYRKLRIFVLEETKVESRLVQLQFLIFFIAYGSKVVTLMYWIKNPPEERHQMESFLINSDLMNIVWIVLPVLFLLCMQIRSFRKMKLEMTQFLTGVEENEALDHPEEQQQKQKLSSPVNSQGDE
mmetsp:Transcript_9882/g.12256  ORF Transcript_9882/g.12256 Transcript_9882/m.12256 type:complete len:308 (+) Transcript_9882:3-926(+)